MSVSPSAVAVGPILGVTPFLVLAGTGVPWPTRASLGRAPGLRWVVLSLAAALEELVWRGLVLGALAAAIGPIGALGFSSGGFALSHRPSLGRRCGVHLVTGTSFGVAFLAGGLVAAVVAHGVYNVLVDLAVHGERVRLRGP